MLNHADGQGGCNSGESASEKLNDAEALFRRLKRDAKADYKSKGQVNWRREAREDFDFAGRKAPDRHFQPRRNNGR